MGFGQLIRRYCNLYSHSPSAIPHHLHMEIGFHARKLSFPAQGRMELLTLLEKAGDL